MGRVNEGAATCSYKRHPAHYAMTELSNVSAYIHWVLCLKALVTDALFTVLSARPKKTAPEWAY